MLRSAKTGDVYIVGAEFGEGFGQMMPGDPLEVITTFNGKFSRFLAGMIQV